MIRFWDSKLTGAPPLLSGVVRPRTCGIRERDVPMTVPSPSDEPVPTTAAEPPPTQYEFGEAENVVFRYLARNLRLGGWGAIGLVAVHHAVLLAGWILNNVPMYERFGPADVAWPVLAVCLGLALIRSGRAFSRVVETRGSDITHLMDGLRRIQSVFTGLRIGIWWLLLVYLFLALWFGVGRLFGY